MDSHVDNRQSRDLLITLEANLKNLISEFKNWAPKIEQKVNEIEKNKASASLQQDHETRLRILESEILTILQNIKKNLEDTSELAEKQVNLTNKVDSIHIQIMKWIAGVGAIIGLVKVVGFDKFVKILYQ